ncbi:MAG: arginine--tRNA ligase [Candidatus Dasytiphilus stammeri]
MNLQIFIADQIRRALISSGIPKEHKIQVIPATKSHFGDYQVNVISLAKSLHKLPEEIANQIVSNLQMTFFAKKIEISKMGYINIYLNISWIAHLLDKMLLSSRLGILPVKKPQTVVIDYSGPNVAKEMHVGHLRSTIIGDATVRTLSFLGHNVIRANHIGDWGLQFGMLIALLKTKNYHDHDDLDLDHLESFYCEAKHHYETDTVFAELARHYVVKLQQGNSECLAWWKKIVNITISENQNIYKRLNVSLTTRDVMGESIYNSMLPSIVTDLKSKGLAVNSNGATVVFLPEFRNKNGNSMGVIIQKKDGGYLYTTTDIACIKFRYEHLHADRIIYYIDSRQNQHLMQVWSIVRKAGYVPSTVSLEHHMFGMMLTKDKKPFQTRKGKIIKLSSLLDEAISRALDLVQAKTSFLSSEEQLKIANIIGIGALKYADLSKNRLTNYVFDWEQMLSFEGNTAPYIQYAYTRAISLFRKAQIPEESLTNISIHFFNKVEFLLGVRLLQFEETLNKVAGSGLPHLMCNYLYNLANLFSHFYEHCPILNLSDESLRKSRLKLVILLFRTLQQGLDTLGIATIERM